MKPCDNPLCSSSLCECLQCPHVKKQFSSDDEPEITKIVQSFVNEEHCQNLLKELRHVEKI